MATVIRIKRRLDEEPTENIVIKSKRSRKESTHEKDDADPEDRNSAVLMRVGTVESKEEPLEPLILKVVKKGWELRENYKRLGTGLSYKDKSQREAKGRAVSKRYKIFSQSRGIDDQGEESNNSISKASDQESPSSSSERTNAEGAESVASSAMEFSYFDAELAHESEDVITCNGVPMVSQKYVYDVFYCDQPVKWDEVMEQNVCRIEREALESFRGLDSDSDSDILQDDDDENEEGNWRNDYPDYDDSPYEDEEDYLNCQLKKYNTRRRYETDESYDEDDYEEEGFDADGNLIMGASSAFSLTKMMRNTYLHDDSDSDD